MSKLKLSCSKQKNNYRNKPKSQQEVPAIKYFLDNNADCKLIKIETNDPDDVDRIFIKVLKEIEVFRHGKI